MSLCVSNFRRIYLTNSSLIHQNLSFKVIWLIQFLYWNPDSKHSEAIVMNTVKSIMYSSSHFLSECTCNYSGQVTWYETERTTLCLRIRCAIEVSLSATMGERGCSTQWLEKNWHISGVGGLLSRSGAIMLISSSLLGRLDHRPSCNMWKTGKNNSVPLKYVSHERQAHVIVSKRHDTESTFFRPFVKY